jgi:poly(3-hydroxybutyrate) depolymerase
MRHALALLAILSFGCDSSPGENSTETDASGGTEAVSSDTSQDETGTSVDPSASAGEGSTTGADSATTDVDPTDDDASGSTGEPPPPNLTPGCGAPASGDVLDGVIEVEGVQREYLIEIPDDYDPNTPYPLVFGFHGDFSDNAQAQSSYRLSEYYEGQAIVVYPNGVEAGGSPAWDTANGSDDMRFVLSVAEEVGLEMCFDLQRVRAYGYSRGAAMSNALGCYRGDLFSAVGASSGWAPSTGLCQRPIGVFLSHGMSDDSVPFVSGTSARDAWAEYNGCSDETVPLELEGCVEYTGCDAGASVQWCEFGGGHQFNTIYAEAAVALFRSL